MTGGDSDIRYKVAGFIWLGAFILAGLMILTGALASGSANFLMGGALFIGAGLATGAMFNWGQLPETPKAEQIDQSKRKNDSGIDPLSLLTEDDIAELREDIKHNLRVRLLQGQDGELGSLDALLAERDQRARRR